MIEYKLELSMLEIYNETVCDLLVPKRGLECESIWFDADSKHHTCFSATHNLR